MKRGISFLPILVLAACTLVNSQPAARSSPGAQASITPSLSAPLHPTAAQKGEAQSGTATPIQPGFTVQPSFVVTSPAASTLSLPRPLPEESILILSPGPGSRLTNPIRVTGVADKPFEQALVVRVISSDGHELAIAPAEIKAEAGQRGAFAVDIAISVEEVMPAFIQVYTASPRDGGITHLAAFDVTLAPKGAPDIKPLNSYLERIVIDHPAPGETIRTGSVRVGGYALASFEQTLIVDIVGPDGTVIGSQSLIVSSPEQGKPGPFSVEVTYSTSSGPGRIVVRDTSPVFNGNLHISSVEIHLEP